MSIRFISALLLCIGLVSSACQQDPLPEPAPDRSRSVWSADFMRTKPGQQERYLAFVDANWVALRAEALEAGGIVSYQVYVSDDTTAGWDVALFTEYADEAAHANAETVFRPLMDAHTLVLIDSLSGVGPDNPLKVTAASLTLRSPMGSLPSRAELRVDG